MRAPIRARRQSALGQGTQDPVHDERAERRATLRAAGWRPSDVVLPICARLLADPSDVTAGCRLAAASDARALISHVARDGAGVPGETMAPLLGVSGVATSRARRRGAELHAAHGWSIDDVLSGRAPDV